MNKFESILFDYGRYVFVSVFRKAQEEERYEDCAVCEILCKNIIYLVTHL